jgi:hypothetical protein
MGIALLGIIFLFSRELHGPNADDEFIKIKRRFGYYLIILTCVGMGLDFYFGFR